MTARWLPRRTHTHIHTEPRTRLCSPPAHAHACEQPSHTVCTQSLSDTQLTYVCNLSHEVPFFSLAPLTCSAPSSAVTHLVTQLFALLTPTRKIQPSASHTISHRTVLSHTCTLMPNLCMFPLAQASNSPRHKCTSTSPHQCLTPKFCLMSLLGMDLPRFSLDLTQHPHCGGMLQAGRGAWALPHHWADPTGPKEKTVPASVLTNSVQHRVSTCLVLTKITPKFNALLIFLPFFW